MKKTKILATSFFLVAICFVLIIGGTLALFTSKSNVNIAATSGKVNVEASIVGLKTYSDGQETSVNGTFENNGTATMEENNIMLNNMTPMDKVVAEIEVKDSSTVTHLQRVSLKAEAEEAEANLFDQLIIGLSEDNLSYSYYGDYTTAWEMKEAVTGEATKTTLYVSIELPGYVGNDWQEKQCRFSLTVEAVQGNAQMADEASAKAVHLVEDPSALATTLTAAKSGDVVVLYDPSFANSDVTIAFEDTKEITVRGWNLATVTVNVPNGTLHIYNEYIEKVDVQAVASDSLHLYGTVGLLNVSQGRAVIEENAAVETVNVVPQASTTAKVAVTANAKVETMNVDTAEGSMAEVTVLENATVFELNLSGSGEVTIDNSGTIIDQSADAGTVFKNVVSDENTLLAALKQDGANIVFTTDITVSKSTPLVPENVTVSIDLGGYTLTSNLNSGLVNKGTILCLSNGKIEGLAYGIANYGHIKTLNVDVQTYAVTKELGAGDAIYVFSGGVIDEIKGGNYIAHPDVYASIRWSSVGLYVASNGLVKEISGGYFSGASVAFRSYNPNGIELISGGFFDSPYMDENGVTYGDKTTIGNLYYNHDPLRVTGGTFYNVGTKLDQKLAEGYTMIKGEICEMTSYKTYIPYNSETQTSAHWEDDPEGKVYYYYTVVAVQSVSTAEELASAVKQKGVLKAIQLNNDINMGNTLVEVRNGKGTYLDLNGFTLTGTGGNNFKSIIKTTEPVLNISNGTITGTANNAIVYAYNNITNMYDVNVTAENGSLAVWAESGATVNIYGNGTIKHADFETSSSHYDLVYATGSKWGAAYINIYGGMFQCATPKWTLNRLDSASNGNGKITVYGGRFYQFDPANAETGADEIVVAEGYVSVSSGDYYTVSVQSN